MRTQEETLSAIERLPLEVLLAITAHLSTPLVHLASASPTLYAQLAPAVHASVALTSHAHLDAFIDRAPLAVKNRTRRLALEKAFPPWTVTELHRLLGAVQELDQLSLAGVALSPFEFVALLAHSRKAVGSLDSLALDFAPASQHGLYSDAHAHAREGTLLPSNAARGDSLAPVHAPARALSLSSHAPLEPSQGSELPSLCCCTAAASMLVRVALALCPSLRSLALANLPSASALCDTPVGSLSSSICSLLPDTMPSCSLRKLELEDVHLGDDDLREVLRIPEASLEEFAVVRCTGLSGAGLAEALKMHVTRLRKLKVVVAAESQPTRRPSPPPSPPRSPPRSPSLASSPSTSQHVTVASLPHALDAALPHLSHLTHLSLSGLALISPSALATLSLKTPHLRSLSISQHTAISPAHLVPLVRPGPSRLARLRSLALHPPSPRFDADCVSSPTLSDDQNEDDSAVGALWAACLASDVDLVGAPFERARERFEWATTEAERVATTHGLGRGRTGRRKRPSLAA